MYKTKIIEIGELVPEFKAEQLLVTFGPQATPELRDMSVIHEVEESEPDPLKLGKTITIGKNKYNITGVGNEANANLAELGHISIYFRDEEQVLPGAIAVEPYEFPDVEIGDYITIDK